MPWKTSKKGKASTAPQKRLREKIPTRLKQPNIKADSLVAMLPNIATVVALCVGLSSVRFALMDRWPEAVIAILIAAVLDAVDGRLARFLGSTTRFGAELDSFSDFISFGVAPALVMYIHTLNQWKSVGWGVALFFSVCMALRLARFNTISIEGTTPDWGKGFFLGIPAPAGGALALSPLVMSFAWPEGVLADLFNSPYLVASIMVLVGCLMISRVPTYSLKEVKIPHKHIPMALLFVGLLAIVVISEPWVALSLIGLIYLGAIPFSLRAYRQLESQHKKSAEQELPL
jgi:CDP-diacylglycerol---serine O-phosphatidyltransferase